MDNKRKMIIMRGVSGSGKTTWVNRFWEQNPKTRIGVCSADFFFMEKGEYKFDPSKLGEAHGNCFQKAIDYVQFPIYEVIIIDNTNISIAEMAPYIMLAQAYGLEIEVVECHCDLKLQQVEMSMV